MPTPIISVVHLMCQADSQHVDFEEDDKGDQSDTGVRRTTTVGQQLVVIVAVALPCWLVLAGVVWLVDWF